MLKTKQSLCKVCGGTGVVANPSIDEDANLKCQHCLPDSEYDEMMESIQFNDSRNEEV